MKYVIYEDKDKKVIEISDAEPVAVSANLKVAVCDNIPQGEYFTLSSIEEEERRVSSGTKKYRICSLNGFTDGSKEKKRRIALLKAKLSATDYKAIKYAEGHIGEEEYSSVKAERQKWREEINDLEKEIK